MTARKLLGRAIMSLPFIALLAFAYAIVGWWEIAKALIVTGVIAGTLSLVIACNILGDALIKDREP